MSRHGAFEPTKKCDFGRAAGLGSTFPNAMATGLPGISTGTTEPQRGQKTRLPIGEDR